MVVKGRGKGEATRVPFRTSGGGEPAGDGGSTVVGGWRWK